MNIEFGIDENGTIWAWLDGHQIRSVPLTQEQVAKMLAAIKTISDAFPPLKPIVVVSKV